MKPLLRIIAGGAATLGMTGCGEGDTAGDPEAPASPIAFAAPPFTMTDVTAESGIDLVTTSGRTPSTQIVEVKGAGLALIDYDGDGDLDLFVPNGATLDTPEVGPGCRLYENLGDMRFRDATRTAGLTYRGWGMGVAVGDYDGDGHADLYIAAFGRDVLLRNTGDGRFTDVSEAAGITIDGWSTGCAFGDLDADGDLDLYVARYVDFDVANPPAPSEFRGRPVLAGPRGLPAQSDVLLENIGGGRFRDVTSSAGCDVRAPSYGLGATILDFDGDGRADIFVGNDSMPNFLFRNATDGANGLRFDEVGVASGISASGDGSSRATMGIAVADVDADGRPDLFTTNFAGEPNTLHLGRDRGFHDDGSRRFGVGMTGMRFLGWACGFYDLDHDGGEDLLIFNGHVYPGATAATMISDYAQTPLLLRRMGPRFERVTAEQAGAWLDDARCDRTAAFGDLDGDGDIDVVTAGLNTPIRVLRNDGADGHWLIVEPRGTAFGALIEVERAGVVQRRWIVSGTGYLSASAASAHFGLGVSGDPVDVHVMWPDGSTQTHRDVACDQHLGIQRRR